MCKISDALLDYASDRIYVAFECAELEEHLHFFDYKNKQQWRYCQGDKFSTWKYLPFPVSLLGGKTIVLIVTLYPATEVYPTGISILINGKDYSSIGY